VIRVETSTLSYLHNRIFKIRRQEARLPETKFFEPYHEESTSSPETYQLISIGKFTVAPRTAYEKASPRHFSSSPLAASLSRSPASFFLFEVPVLRICVKLLGQHIAWLQPHAATRPSPVLFLRTNFGPTTRFSFMGLFALSVPLCISLHKITTNLLLCTGGCSEEQDVDKDCLYKGNYDLYLEFIPVYYNEISANKFVAWS